MPLGRSIVFSRVHIEERQKIRVIQPQAGLFDLAGGDLAKELAYLVFTSFQLVDDAVGTADIVNGTQRLTKIPVTGNGNPRVRWLVNEVTYQLRIHKRHVAADDKRLAIGHRRESGMDAYQGTAPVCREAVGNNSCLRLPVLLGLPCHHNDFLEKRLHQLGNMGQQRAISQWKQKLVSPHTPAVTPRKDDGRNIPETFGHVSHPTLLRIYHSIPQMLPVLRKTPWGVTNYITKQISKKSTNSLICYKKRKEEQESPPLHRSMY